MKPKFFRRKPPQITLVTASGRVLSVAPGEGRHVLAFHGLSALSIADVRGIDDYTTCVFDSVLGNDTRAETCFAVIEQFSTKLKHPSFPAGSDAAGRAYSQMEAAVPDTLRKIYEELSAYKYGEFSLFGSKAEPAMVSATLNAMKDYSALAVLSNEGLAIRWLIGLELESDTSSVACESQDAIVSLAFGFL